MSAVSEDYRFKGGPIDLKLSNAFEMSEREKLKNFKDPTSVFNLAWKGRAKGLKLFLPSSYCTFEKACKRPPMTVAVNQLLEPSANCIKILTLKVCRYSSEGGSAFRKRSRGRKSATPSLLSHLTRQLIHANCKSGNHSTRSLDVQPSVVHIENFITPPLNRAPGKR